MSRRKIGIVAGSVVAAGALLAGGAAIANAADTPTPSPSTSTPATPGRAGGVDGNHTAATAAETAKVKAAVKAKDAAATITQVVKEGDGSFDAWGTKAGANIKFEVSADLKTITAETGGRGGGRGGHGGGPGGSNDTPVTGAEAAKVTAAVKAKDATVTVTSVRKDPDGSYDALGTKAGAPVMVEVSKDLKTVTVQTGGPGGAGGHHGPGAPGTATGGPGDANGAAPSATSTTT